jgi:branched-chain amino acid transport system permease protein
MSVGYVLIYSLVRFTNFAHGLAVTAGAYLAYVFLVGITENLFLGMAFGVLSAAILSMLIELVFYRTLLQRSAKRSFLTIMGLGVSVMGLNLTILIFSGRFKAYPVRFTSEPILFFGATLSLVDIIIIITSVIVLVLVQLLIQKTRFGLAIRAAAHDLDTTSLMGVDVHRMLTTVFVIAGVLAGIAGVLLGAKYQVYPVLGQNMTNKAFISAVVGGLGSLPGAVLGSFVLATGEVMIAGYLSSHLRDVFAYMLLVAILLLRPAGIMGKYFDDKA